MTSSGGLVVQYYLNGQLPVVLSLPFAAVAVVGNMLGILCFREIARRFDPRYITYTMVVLNFAAGLFMLLNCCVLAV